MKKTFRMALIAMIIVVICSASALCGFAWGVCIQFRHIVFSNQAEVAKDILIAKICTEPGCDAMHKWVITELPLLMYTYSTQYALLHEPLPQRLIDIASDAWIMRHSVDEAIKPPNAFRQALNGIGVDQTMEQAIKGCQSNNEKR
jgi:hypothetical protein